MQLRQRPHTRCPSPDTRSPGCEVVDVVADLDDLADELVPDGQRRPDRPLRPVVPGTDVQVGPADAGLGDPDEHVVDPDLGLRHVGQVRPGAASALTSAFSWC
jgi:hypothetical protein